MSSITQEGLGGDPPEAEARGSDANSTETSHSSRRAILGTMAEQTKGVWPIDLVLVYITPSSHAVGPRFTLQTIDRRLSGLPLRPVLRLLAIVAHQADRTIADRDERLALAKALLRPGPTRERALALITSGPHAIVSSQTALVLALRALVSCPDEPRLLDDEELGYRLGELLVALGDHLGTRTSGDHLLLNSCDLDCSIACLRLATGIRPLMGSSSRRCRR